LYEQLAVVAGTKRRFGINLMKAISIYTQRKLLKLALNGTMVLYRWCVGGSVQFLFADEVEDSPAMEAANDKYIYSPTISPSPSRLTVTPSLAPISNPPSHIQPTLINISSPLSPASFWSGLHLPILLTLSNVFRQLHLTRAAERVDILVFYLFNNRNLGGSWFLPNQYGTKNDGGEGNAGQAFLPMSILPLKDRMNGLDAFINKGSFSFSTSLTSNYNSFLSSLLSSRLSMRHLNVFLPNYFSDVHECDLPSQETPKWRRGVPFPVVVDSSFIISTKPNWSSEEKEDTHTPFSTAVVRVIKKITLEELGLLDKDQIKANKTLILQYQQAQKSEQLPSEGSGSNPSNSSARKVTLSALNTFTTAEHAPTPMGVRGSEEEQRLEIDASIQRQYERTRQQLDIEVRKDVVVGEEVYVHIGVYNPLVLGLELLRATLIFEIINEPEKSTTKQTPEISQPYLSHTYISALIPPFTFTTLLFTFIPLRPGVVVIRGLKWYLRNPLLTQNLIKNSTYGFNSSSEGFVKRDGWLEKYGSSSDGNDNVPVSGDHSLIPVSSSSPYLRYEIPVHHTLRLPCPLVHDSFESREKKFRLRNRSNEVRMINTQPRLELKMVRFPFVMVEGEVHGRAEEVEGEGINDDSECCIVVTNTGKLDASHIILAHDSPDMLVLEGLRLKKKGMIIQKNKISKSGHDDVKEIVDSTLKSFNSSPVLVDSSSSPPITPLRNSFFSTSSGQGRKGVFDINASSPGTSPFLSHYIHSTFIHPLVRGQWAGWWARQGLLIPCSLTSFSGTKSPFHSSCALYNSLMVLYDSGLSSLPSVKKSSHMPRYGGGSGGQLSPSSRTNPLLYSPPPFVGSSPSSPDSLPTSLASFETLLMQVHRPRPFYFVMADEGVTNKTLTKLTAVSYDSSPYKREVKVLILDECGYAVRSVVQNGDSIGLGKTGPVDGKNSHLTGYVTSTPSVSPYISLIDSLSSEKQPSSIAPGFGEARTTPPSPHLALPHGEPFSFSSFFKDLILHPGEELVIPCIIRATAAMGVVKCVD
jgi:hypothetical protein